MKIKRTFGDYFPYSLHDARIVNIAYEHGNLILYFDYIFSYNNNRSENTHQAKVIFEQADLHFVDFLLFDSTVRDTFSGSCIELEEYQTKYPKSEFEVIVETYNWGRAVLQGWLWTDGNPVDCILNIFYSGDMIYEIEE